MKKKHFVAITIFVSLFVSILCITGFAISINEQLNENQNQKKTAVPIEKEGEQKEFTVVGLGDSLTRGIGDEDGEGYFGILKKKFKLKDNPPLSFVNLSVSGAKSKDFLALLNQTGTQYTIKKADIIVMTMGGNDLFPGIEALQNIDLTTYTGDIEQFEKDVQTILKTIRSFNSEAPIYWLSLYYPFEDIPQLKQGSLLTSAWNGVLQKVASNYNDVYIVPTYDLFQGETGSLLYSDHFHPNKKGYEQIANRLLQKIESQYR
ncbi:MAG: GDSL-type esterase/lipase family protein [Bacillaceae bacterium]